MHLFRTAYDYQCGSSEKCCNSKCISSSSSCYCTYDSDCDIGEDCCGGVCSSSHCGWSGGAIAGAIIGTIIFFAIIISIVSCLCCACCPYYRYLTPGTVVVTGQQPQQQMVSTHTHLTTQQVHVPPSVKYNQPPPAGYNLPPEGFNQAPPPYLSYPPPPNQYPQPPGQAQAAPMPAAINAGQPNKV